MLWNTFSNDIKLTTSILKGKEDIHHWDGNNCTYVSAHNYGFFLLLCVWYI